MSDKVLQYGDSLAPDLTATVRSIVPPIEGPALAVAVVDVRIGDVHIALPGVTIRPSTRGEGYYVSSPHCRSVRGMSYIFDRQSWRTINDAVIAAYEKHVRPSAESLSAELARMTDGAR